MNAKTEYDFEKDKIGTARGKEIADHLNELFCDVWLNYYKNTKPRQ